MKVNVFNQVAVAFVISGMLLMGTSIPAANAQENQDKQQLKQQRKAEQQQSEQQQAAQKQTNKQQRKQQAQAEQQQQQSQQQNQAAQKQANKQQRKQDQQPVARQQRQTQAQQQQVVERQQQRQTEYREQLAQQQRLTQQRTALLQQQRRMAQYRYQQQYWLREDQIRIQNARNYSRDRNRYFYSAPNYRYSRGGSYYETNQYGANLLRQAVNYGYEQGFRSGQADRQDRWQSSYKDSYAYQDANYGYSGYYVDRDDYNYYFREGFSRGYEDGYDSRYQYGRYSNGTYSILGAVLSSILNLQSLR
jgi:hypothetical protein